MHTRFICFFKSRISSEIIVVTAAGLLVESEASPPGQVIEPRE